MLKKLAYKIVLNDLLKCNMFIGIYDAKHGNPSFMDGIGTVMESIAYSVGNKTGGSFSELFTKNMVNSEKVLDSLEEQCYNKSIKEKRGK